MTRLERIRQATRKALALGAAPGLAQKILLSSLGEEGTRVLEKRFQALLDTLPPEVGLDERMELARMVWG
ncbi:hypothetical protein [Thermus scotoductus]|uniref:Uncharacterized protein n=1 Tax=Thermus scotoductus TaxID=37636 RepID=A0A430V1V8_THESC|nr:hypothetical protein [Thermus scotoductus]RTI16353.1 hypothetical protein CSW27_04005 [Thermus scotoductus]